MGEGGNLKSDKSENTVSCELFSSGVGEAKYAKQGSRR
jgi:hypothetical protein